MDILTLTNDGVEVRVIEEPEPEGLVYRLETHLETFNLNSNTDYTSASKAISDARIAFDMLNGLSQLGDK